jgi:hypothetical protein
MVCISGIPRCATEHQVMFIGRWLTEDLVQPLLGARLARRQACWAGYTVQTHHSLWVHHVTIAGRLSAPHAEHREDGSPPPAHRAAAGVVRTGACRVSVPNCPMTRLEGGLRSTASVSGSGCVPRMRSPKPGFPEPACGPCRSTLRLSQSTSPEATVHWLLHGSSCGASSAGLPGPERAGACWCLALLAPAEIFGCCSSVKAPPSVDGRRQHLELSDDIRRWNGVAELTKRLCNNPRVGGSRPVPHGTFTALVARGREAFCTLLFFRDTWDTVEGVSDPTAATADYRVAGATREAMAPGAPQRRASVGGARERSDRSKGPGAQRRVRERSDRRDCRLCRPPSVARCQSPLMPFLTVIPRVWSFSGRLEGISVAVSAESSAYHMLPFTRPFIGFLLVGRSGLGWRYFPRG